MNRGPDDEEVDESRLVDLIRGHYSSIFGYILRRVGDPNVAADLRQATFLAFFVYWRRRNGLRNDDAIRILYGLAKRKIGNWRCGQLQAEVPTDDELLMRRLGNIGVSDLVGRSIDVGNALSRLSAEHRTVLLLVCVEGLSYNTVAALMRKTRDQVNNLLRAAKKAARALPDLSGYGGQGREEA